MKETPRMKGVIARGQFPIDSGFSWLEGYDSELKNWTPILSRVCKEFEKSAPKNTVRFGVRAMNYMLVNLSKMGLPNAPTEFFCSSKEVGFKEFADALGLDISNKGTLSGYVYGYNGMVRILDEVLSGGVLPPPASGTDAYHNPFVTVPKVPLTGKQLANAGFAKGNAPLDKGFEWIAEYRPELIGWTTPLKDAFIEIAATLSSTIQPRVLGATNHLLLALEELNLPSSPEEFFCSDVTVSFLEFRARSYPPQEPPPLSEAQLVRRHGLEYRGMLSLLERVKDNISSANAEASQEAGQSRPLRLPLLPHPPHLKVELSLEDRVAKGYSPKDGGFEWLHLLDERLDLWGKVLSLAYASHEGTAAGQGDLLTELNWFAKNIVELGLPCDPVKAFSMPAQITYEKYIALREAKNGAKIKGHQVTTRYNQVVMGLDAVLEENLVDTLGMECLRFAPNSVNPLAYSVGTRMLARIKHYSNPSLKILPKDITFPVDLEFRWLALVGGEAPKWEGLLKKEMANYFPDSEDCAPAKLLASEVNWLLTSLEKFSLPDGPQGFYSSSRSAVTEEVFASIRYNEGHELTPPEKSRYGSMVDLFDKILLSEFSVLDDSGFRLPLEGYKNPLTRQRPKLIFEDKNLNSFDALEEFYQPWKSCLKGYLEQLGSTEKTRRVARTSMKEFLVVFLRQERVSLDPFVILGGVVLDKKYDAYLNGKGLEQSAITRYKAAAFDFFEYAVKYFTQSIRPSEKLFSSPLRVRGAARTTNRSKTLDFILKDEPRMKNWADTAENYLSSLKILLLGGHRSYLAVFLNHIKDMEVYEVVDYLKMTSDEKLKAYWEETKKGASIESYRKFVNVVFNFIEWIRFDLTDDGSQKIGFNPLVKLKHLSDGIRKEHPSETVKSMLPRYIIDQLMNIAFPKGAVSFQDLEFCHSSSKNWYKVQEELIDKNDPDCVWKLDKPASGKPQFLMWNPCFSVMFMLLSSTALRGHQIRFLDSGEADTYRYEKDGFGGYFIENTSPLSAGSKQRPRQQGVFYAGSPLNAGEDCRSLYINTNKTADVGKSESNKGYVTPILNSHDLLFWMTKLRSWQEKYNPVVSLTKWEDIPSSVIGSTNTTILKQRQPTTFLFRDPAARSTIGKNSPIAKGVFKNSFRRFMEAAEVELGKRGITRDDGSSILLFDPVPKESGYRTANYTVHSFRVSMISYLILDCGVPIEIVSKMIAGHASIVMTLHYTVLNEAKMREVLDKLELNSIEASKLNAIRDLESQPYEKIAESFAGLDLAKAVVAAKESPSASYLFTNVGICPVAGSKCDVGGEPKNDQANCKEFQPVPGYPKQNCIRCRFNLTNPAFLPGLVARFNEASWRVSDLRKGLPRVQSELNELEDMEYKSELEDIPFAEGVRLKGARERMKELSKVMSEAISDMQAASHLINVCVQLGKKEGDNMALVSTSEIENIEPAILETESELYSTAILCQNAEIFKTIDAGKATLRQAQMLDIMLETNSMSPVLYRLDEQQQLLAGNELMRLLQRHTPNNTIGEALPFAEGRQRLEELGILKQAVEKVVTQSLNAPATMNISEPRDVVVEIEGGK